jgi:cytochrome c-type biogenesis protein CcmH/NrfF
VYRVVAYITIGVLAASFIMVILYKSLWCLPIVILLIGTGLMNRHVFGIQQTNVQAGRPVNTLEGHSSL